MFFINLSGQIAIAIQNALYVAQIKQSLVETQYQVAVNSELSSVKTVEDVLDVLMKQAERFTAHLHIYLSWILFCCLPHTPLRALSTPTGRLK